MKPHHYKATMDLAHAVRHHLHVRQVAEGQGLIPPLRQPQPPQPPQKPQQAAPQPGNPPMPPAAAAQQVPPVAPPTPSTPPNDPTKIAQVQNRSRNALLKFGTGAGMPATASANR